MHAAARAVSAVNGLLARALRVIVAVQAAVMLASIGWAVFTRTVFRHSPPWSEEVALLMFSWIVLLMTALGVRDFTHVRLDAMLRLLPAGLRRAMDRCIALVMAGLGAYLLRAGLQYVTEMGGSTSAAMRYPVEILYAALPVAGALIVLFGLERALVGPPAEPTAG